MSVQLLEPQVEDLTVVPIFPPEDTIPLTTTSSPAAFATRDCFTSIVQCPTDMCATKGCTTWCGTGKGSYSLCGC